jgi:nucleoside permease NupC
MGGLAIALVVCAMLIAYLNVVSLVRARFRPAAQGASKGNHCTI